MCTLWYYIVYWILYIYKWRACIIYIILFNKWARERAFNRGRLNYYGFPFAKDRNKSLWTSEAINAVNVLQQSIGFRDGRTKYDGNTAIIITIIIIDPDLRRPRIRCRLRREGHKSRWAPARRAMSYLFKRQRAGVRLNVTRDRLPWPFVVQLSLITRRSPPVRVISVRLIQSEISHTYAITIQKFLYYRYCYYVYSIIWCVYGPVRIVGHKYKRPSIIVTSF